MSDFYLVRHGGADLNFHIVGGTVRPANPAENTIWVNTADKIEKWIFSANSPTAPTKGLLWINTAASSKISIDALKRNSIILGLIGAALYNGTLWERKSAEIFSKGAWITLETYLYYKGNEFSELTGGFESFAVGHTDANGVKGTIVRDSTELRFSAYLYTQGTILRTVKPVDLTPFSKLVFNGIYNATANLITTWNQMCVWDERIVTQAASGWFYTGKVASIGTNAPINGDWTLDISSLRGKYYVGFGAYESGETVNITMRTLKLE